MLSNYFFYGLKVSRRQPDHHIAPSGGPTEVLVDWGHRTTLISSPAYALTPFRVSGRLVNMDKQEVHTIGTGNLSLQNNGFKDNYSDKDVCYSRNMIIFVVIR